MAGDTLIIATGHITATGIILTMDGAGVDPTGMDTAMVIGMDTGDTEDTGVIIIPTTVPVTIGPIMAESIHMDTAVPEQDSQPMVSGARIQNPIEHPVLPRGHGLVRTREQQM